MKMLAERARYPIPVAGVIQAAMHQQQRRQVVAPPIPKLQLQAIGIVIVGDGFQSNYSTGRLKLSVYL